MSQIASFYLIKNNQRQELSDGDCSGAVYMTIWDWCESELDLDVRFPAPQTEDTLDCALLERERSIQEISGQIQDYALPFFARFSNLPKLLDDVEQEGFFPHRKGFDVPKRNREFIECFREYLQKQ